MYRNAAFYYNRGCQPHWFHENLQDRTDTFERIRIVTSALPVRRTDEAFIRESGISRDESHGTNLTGHLTGQ